MINWILGGIVLVTACSILKKALKKAAKGECVGCSGCDGGCDCADRNT